MSLATYDLENHSQAGFMPLNNVGEFSTISTNMKQGQDYLVAPLAVQKAPFSFKGRIKIPGLPLLPDQLFTAFVHGNIITIQNEPIAPWPIFSFEFELQP